MRNHKDCPYYRMEGEHAFQTESFTDGLALCTACGSVQRGVMAMHHDMKTKATINTWYPTAAAEAPFFGLLLNPTLELWAIEQETD